MTFDYRKDNRTEEEFAADIKFRTLKEKFLMELYAAEMRHMGHTVVLENNGTDNTGKLKKKGVTAAPDYRVTTNGEVALVEVKNSPVGFKWTFKVYNLKQYVKAGASILIFWDTGYIDKDPNKINLDKARFGMITHENLAAMLEEYEHYKEPKFGNKVCIQIPKDDFSKWLTPRRITHV